VEMIQEWVVAGPETVETLEIALIPTTVDRGTQTMTALDGAEITEVVLEVAAATTTATTLAGIILIATAIAMTDLEGTATTCLIMTTLVNQVNATCF
jgi:hypothetical protein